LLQTPRKGIYVGIGGDLCEEGMKQYARYVAYQHDVLVIGGAEAGLRAAIAAAETSDRLSIAVLSKVYSIAATRCPPGEGRAAVMRDNDSLDTHARNDFRERFPGRPGVWRPSSKRLRAR